VVVDGSSVHVGTDGGDDLAILDGGFVSVLLASNFTGVAAWTTTDIVRRSRGRGMSK